MFPKMEIYKGRTIRRGLAEFSLGGSNQKLTTISTQSKVE